MALLLPESGWPLLAYQYLREGPSPTPWPAAFDDRLKALRTCVTGHGAVKASPEAPELALLTDPGYVVANRERWGKALADSAHWPWAQAVMTKETPQTDLMGKQAQINRLGVLGRLLHLCRFLHRDPGERTNAWVYASLVKMPSSMGRQAVLKYHIKWLCSPETSDWAQQVERIFTQCKTAEARILALLTYCLEPGLAVAPATVALVNSSAVVKAIPPRCLQACGQRVRRTNPIS